MGEEISAERFKKPVGASDRQPQRSLRSMSRRKFLGLLGAGAGALVTRKLLQSGSEEKNHGKNVVDIESHEVLTERFISEQDLIFGDQSKSADVQSKIRESRSLFEGVLLEQAAEYDQLIRQKALEWGIPEYLLFGLVLTESKGERFAISNAGAKGLTQMMPDKAREYGLYVNDDYTEYDPNDSDERYIPEKIIPATVEELWKKFERLGNWGLVFWEWNLGEGNLWNALNEHFEGSMPEINYRNFLEQSRVSVYDVLENNLVQDYLIDVAKVDWDETKIFVYNIVAGSQLYKGFRPPTG